jgi:uncharacterized protein
MQRYAKHFTEFAKVVSFDYPYVGKGRRVPDPLPRLIEAHREALEKARAGHDGKVFLVGKSMGSRVGCHLALSEAVDGLVCLGYPLKGQSGKVRDQVLLELETRILFIQGTRDPLCPLADLEAVRTRMQAASELFVVDGGDHSLELQKGKLARLATTQGAIEREVCERVRAFVIFLSP